MKLVIFDMDGVLIRGKEAVEHAPEAVRLLQNEGFLVRYLTNNSTQTPETYANRLEKVGITAKPSEIMTSSIATARYLKEKSPNGGKVLVVGGEGLVKALQDEGFTVVDYGDPSAVDFVTAGMDRNFTYDRLARAQHEILVNKAEFIATNYDCIFPVENGGVKPGGGVIVRALEVCTYQKALVIGKPEPTSILFILGECGIDPSDTAIVGDNLDTDIQAGIRAGIRSIFVLTGIHSMKDIEHLDRERAPDYILKDLSTLMECLK
jgi:4-nitrophenyl phosphatase